MCCIDAKVEQRRRILQVVNAEQPDAAPPLHHPERLHTVAVVELVVHPLPNRVRLRADVGVEGPFVLAQEFDQRRDVTPQEALVAGPHPPTVAVVPTVLGTVNATRQRGNVSRGPHEISRIAHLHHRIAAPVDADQLARLVTRLTPPAGGRALDLVGTASGCSRSWRRIPASRASGSTIRCRERRTRRPVAPSVNASGGKRRTRRPGPVGGSTWSCVSERARSGRMLAEWDDYEWSWAGSLTEWALREALTDDDRREALEIARAHHDEWLRGYRGQLGFVTVVLYDPTTPPAPAAEARGSG